MHGAAPQVHPHRQDPRAPGRRILPPRAFALVAGAWLLLACDVGGDPAQRARYEADDQRCRGMADSMVAAARARGGEVDKDAFEPARLSCMRYRGWKDGKFR